MTLITAFTVPAEAFALEHTFETLPDVTVEVERLATHSREWVMPFLWVTGDDLESVEATLREDPSVTEYRVLDTTDGAGYFNVHWSEDVQRLVDRIVDRQGIVQEAQARDGTWYLKLQFVDRDALEGFQTHFRDSGYEFELHRIYDGIDPKERQYDLTPAQYETLTTALEMGYFAVPRETQIGDLAEELGISTNAVSQRLRRATGNLTENTLAVSPSKDATDER